MIVTKRKYLLLITFFSFLIMASCGIKKGKQDRPDFGDYHEVDLPRIKENDSLYFIGGNSIRKNAFGQWELVAKGNPMELGNTIGALSKELILKQEEIFFSKIEEFVPSKFKQNLLRHFLAWYNRQMYLHIENEYKIEIELLP